jgi:hypothetical protein
MNRTILALVAAPLALASATTSFAGPMQMSPRVTVMTAPRTMPTQTLNTHTFNFAAKRGAETRQFGHTIGLRHEHVRPE